MSFVRRAPGARLRRRRLVVPAVLFTMALAASLPAIAAVAPLPNPAFPDACGVDVAVVLDTSNSITRTSGGVLTPENEGKMKDAAKLVVNTLSGTPSRVGVFSFRTTATTEIGYTDLADPANAAAVNAAIDAIDYTIAGASAPNPGGTNWEAAFDEVGPTAEVILFATDGNPTTRAGDDDPGALPGEPEDLDAGIVAANNRKAGGARIIGIAIGPEITVANIQLVSGPTANDDYYLADFDTLANALRAITVRLCAPSVTLLKTVDGVAAPGWSFTVTAPDAGTPVIEPPDGVTSGNGVVNYKWDTDQPFAVTVTEVTQPGYVFSGATCTVNGDGLATQPLTHGVGFTVGPEDIVQCTFANLTNPAAIDVVKTPDSTVAAVGDTVTYTYTVTNTGSVPVAGLTVVDDLLGPVTVNATSLAPGASATGTLTTTVGTAALPGPVVNVVTASAVNPQFPDDPPVTDQDTATVGLVALELAKTPDAASAPVGATVTYTYTVTNTGSVPVSGVTLTDDVLGPLTPAATTLAPGASTTATATHVVTEGDLPGPLVNVATATGAGPGGEPVSATDSASVELTATTGLTIEKQPSLGVAAPGDDVVYTYTVTNTGTVTLTGLAVSDDLLGPITLAATTLAPGASTTGTATATVAAADLPGPIVNVATADATAPDGTPVSATDTATVDLAGLEIVKTADPLVASLGDTVTYTFTVTNTGSIPLSGLSVSDDKLGPIVLAATTLAPGATTTGTATHVVSAADGTGPIENVGTASATTAEPDPVTGEPRTVTAEDEAAVALVLVEPTVITTTTEVLPETGADTAPWAATGAALVLLGLALLVAVRTRSS